MFVSKKTKIVLILFLNIQLFLFAQNNDYQNKYPSFQPKALKTPPKLDGDIINDSVWKTITPIKNLTQIRPSFGAKASEETAIRVGYTKTTLYVGVVCFDSSPESIVISGARRDSDLSNDDSFLFILDTYNDKQNGFLFGTNASGMEYDAQIDNEGIGNSSINGAVGGTNLNWDASWTVKTQKGNYGWSAEFAIPFRSLRFASGENKTWGINFQRNISKTTETAFWSPLPLGFNIKRLSLAGKIKGLNLKKPGNLKVIPYVLAQHSNNSGVSPNVSKTRLDAGADIKYSITPSLTLDLTYNTDFAQVEVDEQQINLDRFNLFFPEKRAFFLENAGQFSVGSPGEIDLFFSRRIGIGTNGDLIPIIGGGRLSGKIGSTNVGLLSMFTDAVDAITKNNFSVARVNHNFKNTRSSLGGIFVNREGLDNFKKNDFNRVYAADGKWGIGNKAEVSGFVSKSKTPSISKNDHAFKIETKYDWNGLKGAVGYTEVGENFNPEVGFLKRSAFRKPNAFIFKTHRLKNWGKMMEIRPHASYRSFWTFNNDLITSYVHIDNHWVYKSGFEIHTGINFTSENVFKPFLLTGVEVPVGRYNHEELQFVLQTNPNKALYFKNVSYIGGYFGGKRYDFRNTLNWRLGDKFSSSFAFRYLHLNLQNGKADATTTSARLSYSFTPRLFLQSLLQHNNVSNIASANIRLGWLQNANTGLFVVLNLAKDDDLLNNQIITVKYTHQFNLLN